MRTLRYVWTIALAALTALTSVAGAAPALQGEEDLPPQVIDVWPFPGEEMPLDSPLFITFDQPMDQPSVETAFATAPGVSGSFDWEDARTLVFSPTDGWERDVVYDVIIGVGARATSGLGLEEPYTFQARTVGYLEVASVVPAEDADGVAADATITVAFNRPVVPLVSTGELADLPSPLTIEPEIEGEGEWLNTSIYQFTPKEPLRGGTTYTGIVHAGLTDIAGAVLPDDFVWRFTTLPPEILSVTPRQGATNVWLESLVRIVFSQPMDRASTQDAFQLLTWGRTVEGTFGWNDDSTEMTFTPAAWLDMESIYSINLADSARSAGGEATLREGITYTFNSMPFPAISSTGPPNGERNVPPGRGASIHFLTPMNTETFRDKVIIEPAPAEWQPAVSGNQSLYLNFATQPETTYTITFLAGAEDVYGNRIETDYTFSFRTGRLEARAQLLRQGNFMVTGAYRENTRMALAVTGTPTVSFRLYRMSVEMIGQAMDRYYDSEPPWARPENLVREWVQTFDSGGAEYALKEVLLASEQGGVLEAGMYWLMAHLPGYDYPEQLALGVVTANLTIKRTADEVLVWVTDMPTAEPVADTTVTIYHAGRPLASGQTDAEGVFRAPARVSERDPVYAVAQSQGVYGVWYAYRASERPKSAGYLYTDRPIYRPDQTLYFRGVLRARDDMTYTVPPQVQTVHVVVDVNWGEQILFEGDLPITHWGTFSGEVELPEDARLGQGQIRATSDDFYGATVYFHVAEFRVPEFQVEVTSEYESIIQGQELIALARASYYFGGPVSNATVDWSAYGNVAYFNYTGATSGRRYTFADEDEDYFGWFNVGSGSATTDANGQFVIRSENTRAPSLRPMLITVEATVTDESQQAISGRTTVMAHPADIYVGLRADRYFGREGQPMEIGLIAVTLDSAPVANKRTDLTVTEIRWTRVEREDEFGRYDWRREEIDVETASVVTGDDGTASYTFTPPQAGIYRVRAVVMDEKERRNSAALRFWVMGERPVWWGRPSNTIDLVTDKDSYRAGDVAEILVPIPFAGGSTVMVSAERAGIIDYEVVQVEGSTLVYELPITEEHVPTVHVTVTLVKGVDEESLNPDYREGQIALSVESVRQTLSLTVTPSATMAQPRDTVSFDIEVRDSTGEPVSAEVGLSLTDLAILSLMPPNSGPLLEAFYGPQSNYVRTGLSMSALLDRLTDEFIPTERERALAGTATPAATMMAQGMLAMAPAAEMADEAFGRGGGGGVEPVVIREQFEQTPLWAPHVVTDASGRATISVDLPDNLTTWRLDARALTADTKVGQTTVDVMATRPLLVRPVAPRFFVVGDRVQLAAVINNNTDASQSVQATLQAAGVVLEDEATQAVEIPAGGRARVTWMVVAQDVPYVDLTFIAIGEDGYQDATKPTLATGPDGTIPVYRYTAPDTVGTGGVLRDPAGGSRTEGISLPPRLDTDQGELEIHLDPSLAVTAIDAFDYLRNYPHLCIEQIISRFLPNAVTYRALRELGIDDDALRENLRVVLNEALERLAKEQKSDGGWGWFSTMESNPLVTAYAALGLIEARDAGFDFDTSMIDRALNFVRSDLIRPGIDTTRWRLNRQAFYFYVLARDNHDVASQMDALFDYRLEMSLEAHAFLLMAYHELGTGDGPQAQALISDLNTAAIVSATGAHWEEGWRDWWNWTSDTRATAIILAALARTQPENALLPNAVRWLMVARQGDHWTTTQETVWAVLGLTDWMVVSGELRGDYEYGVSLNRERLTEGTVSPDTVREGQVLRVQVRDLLRDELNRLTISRGEGEGVLYYTAHLKTRLWASEAKAISRGVTVQREYFAEGDPDTPVTEAKVGDVITVRLTITLPQDIYYFVLEDPIPAGTEGVDTSLLTTSTLVEGPVLRPQRNPRWWWGWWWFKHTEMRDEQVNLYADFLPHGTYVYTYQVRASVAGEFQTMPSHAYAFYFPEVFGRGEGMLFTVLPEQ